MICQRHSPAPITYIPDHLQPDLDGVQAPTDVMSLALTGDMTSVEAFALIGDMTSVEALDR